MLSRSRLLFGLTKQGSVTQYALLKHAAAGRLTPALAFSTVSASQNEKKAFTRKRTEPAKTLRTGAAPDSTISLEQKRQTLMETFSINPLSPFTSSGCTEKALGKIYRMPDESSDRLGRLGLPRYVERDWQYMAEDAFLVRDVTLRLNEALSNISREDPRNLLLVGEQGVGKSMALLQAVNMALTSNKIVLYFPATLEWIFSRHPFLPSPGDQGTFAQPTLTAAFLEKFLILNPTSIEGLTLSKDHTISSTSDSANYPDVSVKAGSSLREMINLGAHLDKAPYATATFEALVEELVSQTAKDVLVAVDQVNGLYTPADYRDTEGRPLDPRRLRTLGAIRSLLDGERVMARGLILSAMTHLDARYGKVGPKVPTLSVPPYTLQEAETLGEYYEKTGAFSPSGITSQVRLAKYVATSGNPRRFFKACLALF